MKKTKPLYTMKNKIWLIFAFLSFGGMAYGIYCAETQPHTMTFVYWAIIAPLVTGGISLCIFMDRRKKRNSSV